jgi:uncharacterized protein (TIGR03067 family)
MTTRQVTLGVVVFALAAAAATVFAQENSRARAEIDRLQGTWNVVALEIDGAPLRDEVYRELQVVVKGNAFTTVAMGSVYSGTVTVDPTTSPKRIELHFTQGPEQGRTNLAIYTLDGDRWMLCVGFTGRDRPLTFTTEAGSGRALETLRRVDASAAGTVRGRGEGRHPRVAVGNHRRDAR